MARVGSPGRLAQGSEATFETDLELRGDVCLRLFHQGIPLFRLQFHTLFLDEAIAGVVQFGLAELDEQNEQPNVFERRFNPACKVRLFFAVDKNEEKEKK